MVGQYWILDFKIEGKLKVSAQPELGLSLAQCTPNNETNWKKFPKTSVTYLVREQKIVTAHESQQNKVIEEDLADCWPEHIRDHLDHPVPELL